jgi:Predicted membrane protein (DUF2306)
MTKHQGKDPISAPALKMGDARQALSSAASLWYVTAAFGQAVFLLFILLFYYPSSLSGKFEAWDNKPNIEGFTAGDTAGNIMFALHVLLAGVMILGGMFQLIPVIRQKWPKVHRWNGRTFMVTAILMAVGGLWLTWGRGSYMNITGAIGISLNALLILGTAAMAWRTAINRQFVQHRRWALRLFIVANAVWFMRLGYVLWGAGTGGAGIGDAMDGPFDLFLAFGNSLVPLAIMEIYLRVHKGKNDIARYAMAAGLAVCALLTLVGTAFAWMGMWGPYI